MANVPMNNTRNPQLSPEWVKITTNSRYHKVESVGEMVTVCEWDVNTACGRTIRYDDSKDISIKHPRFNDKCYFCRGGN